MKTLTPEDKVIRESRQQVIESLRTILNGHVALDLEVLSKL